MLPSRCMNQTISSSGPSMVSLKFFAASMRSSWSKGGVRKLQAIFSFLKKIVKSGFA